MSRHLACALLVHFPDCFAAQVQPLGESLKGSSIKKPILNKKRNLTLYNSCNITATTMIILICIQFSIDSFIKQNADILFHL